MPDSQRLSRNERLVGEQARPMAGTRSGNQSVAAATDKEEARPPTACSPTERLGQSGVSVYSVWDDDAGHLIARGVPWADVIDAIYRAGAEYTPVDLQARVDADETALVWAGFTIQREVPPVPTVGASADLTPRGQR